MLRIVLGCDGKPVFDYLDKFEGRGAYLCANKECISKGIKLKNLKKAFKNNGKIKEEIKPEEFIETILSLLYRRIEELIMVSYKARKIEIGVEKVKSSIEKDLKMVILSNDIQIKNEINIVNRCLAKGVEIHKIEKDRYWLGNLINKEQVTAIGIKEDGLAKKLSETFTKLNGIKFS